MADDDAVGAKGSRARPPELLPSPVAAAAGLPKLPLVKPPFFLGLAQERQNYLRGFEALRDNQRRERIKALQIARGSRVLVYYSIGTLTQKHAELLHDVLQSRPAGEKLDLFLLSPGGYADAGHKMATLCRSHAKHFGVLIPYYAKSAATLLSLGSDELVMGPASEIGPIDPRIRIPDRYGRLVDVSAVSVRDALDLLEERSKGSPELALLYAPLLEQLDVRLVGEYERALKSSEQIAETLLGKYMLKNDPAKAKDVASKLSHTYYSHGSIIDRVEANDVLGLNVTHADGALWETMWQLHKLYEALIEESRDAATGRQTEAVFETEDMKIASLTPPPSADARAEHVAGG